MPPLDPAQNRRLLQKMARFPSHQANAWLHADQAIEKVSFPPVITPEESELRRAVVQAPENLEYRLQLQAWLQTHPQPNDYYYPWALKNTRFEHGLLVAASLTARTFISRGEALFQREPLQHLMLEAVGPLLAKVVACPWLQYVKVLDLAKVRVNLLQFRELAASSFVSGLQELILAQAWMTTEEWTMAMNEPNLFQKMLRISGSPSTIPNN